MSERMTLKDALIQAFEHLKQQDALISAMTCETEALRETIFSEDPGGIARFEGLFASKMEQMLPTISSSSRVFDSIIELLKADARWVN